MGENPYLGEGRLTNEGEGGGIYPSANNERNVFYGCTVQLDIKKTKLGSSNQEVFHQQVQF